ncbi:FAD-binding oxidoreductase [Candidatus Lokiarchaeum ossiferum]|uniref:FAD-binding oxidoreductase n=1 Tax=Candidatus Lokiarchaeum ossiferum TaxID=2951803 RepID=UPI00352BF451
MFRDIRKIIQAAKIMKYRNMGITNTTYFDGLGRLAKSLHPTSQTLKVVNKTSLSTNVTLIRLCSVESSHILAPFRAGQYIGLHVNIDGVLTGRSYSIVSSPHNLAFYEIAVKDLGSKGFVSTYLCNELKVGEIIEATEPMGLFYYNPIFHGTRLVLVAGGCGITPFISMMRNFHQLFSDYEIHLIYGCLSESDILFQTELLRMSQEMANFSFTIILSDPSPTWSGLTGFVTAELLQKTFSNMEEISWYIVGPHAMQAFLQKELKKIDISPHQIHYDLTPPISNITQTVGWPKEINTTSEVLCTVSWINENQRKSVQFNVPCTKPLLNSLEAKKIPSLRIKTSCRAGECAFCRSKLLDGNVFVPPQPYIRKSDQKNGYIHPCISYPIEDVHIEIYPEK